MRHSRRTSGGFTLVELLVVIGIIALLISLLLPALNGVRRQAASVKCMASLRELGNACRMYVEENRGAAVPLRIGGGTHNVATKQPYELYGITYGAASNVPGVSNTQAAWWMNFIAKYVTKTKGGTADMSKQGVQLNQKTVIWGCPAWSGIKETGVDAAYSEMELHTTGYNLNYMPTYTAGYPASGTDFPPDREMLDIVINGSAQVQTDQCTWWKFTKYTDPARRALLADCFSSVLEAKAAPLDLSFPPMPLPDTKQYANGKANTTFDFYRHGSMPRLVGGTLQSTGGKISFNILYADGHVANVTDRAEAYRSIRMRYPG
jgi:prepilin-type N-terminal cleavage/methylation domain-containing protein/prepilin-type processing-associated H-X9-DG protein